MKLGESKETAFKRLATNRANTAINYIRLLGNLSNTNNYNFSEQDIKTIFGAVEEELRNSKARFNLSLNKKRKIKL